MPRGIAPLGQDFISSTKITTGAAASTVFTPADGPQTSFNGKPTALFSEEVVLQNVDATNAVWVRFQLPTNELVSQGIALQNGGQAGGSFPAGAQQFGSMPPSVDSTKFIAATAGTKGELFVPPATVLTVRVRAIGISTLAAAGNPILYVSAVGANNLT
ncbi:MAG TPA: hypothetical protein VKG44_01940 [Candidatus Baltobacteraceae bacterium]|nr:hypothetical protein [Candidatus Baltobacteraceae bacterium]